MCVDGSGPTKGTRPRMLPPFPVDLGREVTRVEVQVDDLTIGRASHRVTGNDPVEGPTRKKGLRGRHVGKVVRL